MINIGELVDNEPAIASVQSVTDVWLLCCAIAVGPAVAWCLRDKGVKAKHDGITKKHKMETYLTGQSPLRMPPDDGM